MEKRFQSNVKRLRSMNDLSLAQFVGSSILESILKYSGEQPVFCDCVKLIRSLPIEILPGDKMNIITKIFESIKTTLRSLGKPVGADDILPILEFILIRGNIQGLGVEIRLIKDFLHPDIQGGEKGLLFCHFFSAYKSLAK